MREVLAVAAVVVPLAVSGLGVLILGYAGLRLIPGAIGSPRWPYVIGRIARREKPSFWFGIGGHDDATQQPIHFDYTYEVCGVKYKGRRVFFGDDMVRTSVDVITDTYPAGCSVRVHYHPTRPQLSVLEPGWHREIFAPVGMGVFFIVFGIFLAYRFTA